MSNGQYVWESWNCAAFSNYRFVPVVPGLRTHLDSLGIRYTTTIPDDLGRLMWAGTRCNWLRMTQLITKNNETPFDIIQLEKDDKIHLPLDANTENTYKVTLDGRVVLECFVRLVPEMVEGRTTLVGAVEKPTALESTHVTQAQ